LVRGNFFGEEKQNRLQLKAVKEYTTFGVCHNPQLISAEISLFKK
jgi:hypothetical protein